MWNYFKIWPAVSEKKILKEFLHVPIVQEAPIHQSHVFGPIKISPTLFWKGSLKEHYCEIISKSDQRFQRRRFLKNCLKNSIFIAMATRVFDGIKFCEQFLKRTSQGTFLPSLVQIGPSVWEEKMFKEIVDNARRTHHHPKSSPWARCAQVS